METKLAKLISYIFHPLLMPTYAFILLFSQKAYFAMIIPISARWRLLLIVFIITFVLPLMLVLLLKSLKRIKSLQMYERKERTLPYIITAWFVFILYLVLNNTQLSPIFKYFTLGATILIVFAFLVNLKWKISMHMIAAGGMLGMILGLTLLSIITNPIYLIAAILISGLIGFARLKLNAHTQAQVYAGLLSGVGIMIVLAFYF